MSYNKARRRSFTPKQRAAFLIAHGSRCYWCTMPITEGQPWAIEHLIPRELMEGADADADENLDAIHAHPLLCHKIKTQRDIRMIAKSNRLRKKNGLDPVTKKERPKMKGRAFQKGKRSIQSRPFQKR